MIKIGIIGCGYIAGKHVATISRIDRLQLAAVSDINQESMRKTITDYQSQVGKKSAVSCYENYEKLIEDPTIDIVVIAVISSLHATVAKQVMKQGKHVILEKPIALSLKEADELITISQETNSKVLVCHQLRYRPLLKKLQEMVENREFGEPYFAVSSLRLHRPVSYYNNSNWKGTWEKDGGMLVNQGIHMVDQLLWMMGQASTIYGELGKVVKTKETEDIATGILQFKNGGKGLIEANTITTPRNLGYELTLFGEKGSFSIGGMQFNELTHCYVENKENTEELRALALDKDEQYYMYLDLLDAIIDDRQPQVSLLEGKQALEAIFALYRADRMKSLIHLPIEDFNTKEMGGKIG
ncbi:Gfo/Idh/MocA family protein [Oceanobacillus manasiensis]|uniref:Gfo/Idh/MocA family protein n=1 Tax=Oceanobacillus manasiensis TaxID=586413 RepID=UPI0005A801EB|nr:Gfo/Idh/MocA family oxidoreductase [Oceanobacillus manasiensis]